MSTITIAQVQEAINACLEQHPIVNQTLPKECGPLAEILGIMAYRRLSSIPIESTSAECTKSVRYWTKQDD